METGVKSARQITVNDLEYGQRDLGLFGTERQFRADFVAPIGRSGG
jgi:hypothetical protein